MFFAKENEENGAQGWYGGESARVPPMRPGFESWTRCHMWLGFSVGSRPCPRIFSGFSGDVSA